MTSLLDDYFSIHPAVNQALHEGKPVVALESTVITHGLPFPVNGELARDLEDEIRSRGCIPATVAILDGRICVGLEPSQVERLSKEKGVRKVSSRDIASTVSNRQSGGTTVAGTLVIAAIVGIKVFSTGGIGGVHRQTPFDISADLQQLSNSPLVVVCAGAKAILDIAATLEVLETYGVPVVGYQTDDFPAFYSMSSDYKVSARVNSTDEVARLAQTHWRLGQKSAVLLTVPPPADTALDRGVVETAIQQSISEAQAQHIQGQAVTPYLLRRVSELTKGSSLHSNLDLLHNNARIAAGVARSISDLANI